jgi:hypothetical protein
MALKSTNNEIHILHTIARTMSLGGTVDVTHGRRTHLVPARSDDEFIDAVSSFFHSEDAPREDTPIPKPMRKIEFDFADYATAMCHNQRLFRTSKGFIGMGPMPTEPGDVVAIVFGSRVPFVLHPDDSDGENLTDFRFKFTLTANVTSMGLCKFPWV